MFTHVVPPPLQSIYSRVCVKVPLFQKCGQTWQHKFCFPNRRISTFSIRLHFHASEKEMATHSSILAWRIPGTEEPGGLPSVGSPRVGHNWGGLAAAAAAADIYSYNSYKQKLWSLITVLRAKASWDKNSWDSLCYRNNMGLMIVWWYITKNELCPFSFKVA